MNYTKLIVGLGNPGERYKNTRHNVGFKAIDLLALKFSQDTKCIQFENKFNGMLYKSHYASNNSLLFLKPISYMNLSGITVLSTQSFYKIPIQNIIIIHDDLDLPIGKVNVKYGGGSAGHNGIKSIDEKIGKNYMRIRIGISKPANKSMIADYVLSDFLDTENQIIDKSLSYIKNNFDLLLKEDIAGFLNLMSNQSI